MPKQSFALESGGPKRLEISWKAFWKDVMVKLDGIPVGTIADQKELTEGREFILPDGTRLSVQLVKKFSSVELQVLRDGQPLPGSAADPETRFKTAYGIVFFIAGLNLVLGLVAVIFDVQFLLAMGIGTFSIFFGLLFLVLGFFVRRMSVAALVIAIAVFALDGILGIIAAVSSGFDPSIGGLALRVVLLIPMFQGVAAIRDLKGRT